VLSDKDAAAPTLAQALAAGGLPRVENCTTGATSGTGVVR
jgi:hypothetical protein